MSTDLARRTSDDICREINACSAKLAQAEKKVDDWKDTRRQFLQELKDRFPRHLAEGGHGEMQYRPRNGLSHSPTAEAGKCRYFNGRESTK